MTFGYVYFLFSDFCIDESIQEYVKFSKPTLPFFIRLSTTAIASTLTMVVYGSRPDPTIPAFDSVGTQMSKLNEYLDSAYVILSFMFFLSFVSLKMLLNKLRHDEDVLLDGDTKPTREIAISTYLLKSTSARLQRLKVEAGDIRMSPLLRAILLSIPIANFVFFVSSVVLEVMFPEDQKLSTFLTRFGETNIPIAFVSSMLYIFSDLNPVRGREEDIKSGRTKWRTISKDLLVMLPCILSLVQPLLIYLGNVKRDSDKKLAGHSNLSKREVGVIEIGCIFAGFFLMTVVTVHSKYITVSRFGTRDLESHLNVVASVAASALPCLVMLCSTANSCTCREYLFAKDKDDEPFTYLHTKCDTINWSTRPLYHLIATMMFLFCSFGMFATGNMFSFERMSKLELTRAEVFQTVLIAVSTATALLVYSVSGRYGASLTAAYVFPQQLVWFVLIILVIFEEGRMLIRVFVSAEEIVVRDLDIGNVSRSTEGTVSSGRFSVVGGESVGTRSTLGGGGGGGNRSSIGGRESTKMETIQQHMRDSSRGDSSIRDDGGGAGGKSPRGHHTTGPKRGHRISLGVNHDVVTGGGGGVPASLGGIRASGAEMQEEGVAQGGKDGAKAASKIFDTFNPGVF